MDVIYVASLQRGAGSTAVAAALLQTARAAGRNAAYFKPVGIVTRGERDADSTFCVQALGLEQSLATTCPVTAEEEAIPALFSGTEGSQRVNDAWSTISRGRDFVVVDGLPLTSVLNRLSADLANRFGSRVLVVTRYRAGLTAEEISASCEPARGRLIGVILNAVPALALKTASARLGTGLRSEGIDFMGAVPEDRRLLSFTVADYARRLGGVVLNSAERGDELVESLLIGAMVTDSSEYYYERKENKALITRGDRPDLQWNALEGSTRCLILTQGVQPIPYVLDKATSAAIPVMVVPTDTHGTVAKLEGFATLATVHHRQKLEHFRTLLGSCLDLSHLGLQAPAR